MRGTTRSLYLVASFSLPEAGPSTTTIASVSFVSENPNAIIEGSFDGSMISCCSL
jgi:hypothetical protein